ncbi:hypothetical protein BDN70DRAFT_131225 [Pholiota conissans]|uniref:MYND-type domain-containing protein n=1 Tax=Pholiota conissans TaxID=109636 RepID=A0A9P5YWQ1_9AGAR|nr:hypothetical protein BDN70DRAFT_131225 [Pholiota conissans]
MSDTHDASSSSSSDVTCAACDTWVDPNEPLMRCGKCKLSSYCSKECQIMHWPIHKLRCIKTKLSPQKLVSSFTGNSYINFFIHIASIAAFSFDKTDPVIGTPYVAQCHLRMTPNASGVLTRPKSKHTPTELEDPEHIRRVYPEHTPVFVEFCVNGSEEEEEGERERVALTFLVKHSLWESMRRDELDELWEVDVCLGMINDHIRDDERNELLLRTFMTKEDVEAYERLVQLDAEEFLEEDEPPKDEEPPEDT